jgi:succinyl-diaminopimelate desuccinylase
MNDKIINLTKKLISISSTQDNLDGLKKSLNLAKHELKDQFTIDEFESNGIPSLLIHNSSQKINDFKIILNAHLDVVPGLAKQFTPIVKDGRIYGRGVYDMKAAAAVMIVLFKEIAHQLPYPIALQLTTDEEDSGENGTRYQLKKGIRAEFAIMGECGSNFRIVNEAKTALNIKLSAKGLSAHGAYPWKGKNAISIMQTVLEKIIKHYPIPITDSYATTINIARIETTNTAHNKVPDNCDAYLDLRISPDDKETILDNIKSLLPDTVELKVLHRATHHFTDPHNHYISQLKNISAGLLGTNVQLINQHATSDARFYSEVGCAAIEFGPVGAGQHQDEEWVDIDSLGKYYQILKEFLLNLN